jgi:hypothetical protein
MSSIPKMLIGCGILLVIVGIVWHFGGRYLNFGKLPGDIVVEKPGFRFYFPVVTCIVLSVVGSLFMYVIRMFTK